MSKNLRSVLSSLRDVDGIVGSFVVNAEGDLVAQDLPAYFDGVAEQVAPRTVRLRDALSLTEGSVSSCTIRYADHKLSLRSVHGALLAVLANHQVNSPALRMAMNLVARKCSPEELANAAFTATPPAVAEETPAEVTRGAAQSTVPARLPPPPPSARAVGATTLHSVAPPPVLPEATPGGRKAEAAHAAADEHVAHRKERAVYFRGKRVN